MGLTWEQITSGIVDVGNVVNANLKTFGQLTGKISVATPTISAAQPASPAAPTTSNLTQNGSGLAALPSWVWLAGGGALLWYLGRRHR